MKNIWLRFILTVVFSTIVNPAFFDPDGPADLWFLILIMCAVLVIIWNPILTRDPKDQTSDRRSLLFERRLAAPKRHKAKIFERRHAISDRRQSHKAMWTSNHVSPRRA